MKKYFAAVAVAALLALSTMAGCYPTGEKNPNYSAEIVDNGHFEYSKDNFTAAFEIPEIPAELPMRIKLKQKDFNAEKGLDLFFGDKTVEKIWEGNYWAEDGSLFYVNSNSIGFSDGKTANLKQFQIEQPMNYQAALTVAEEYYRERFGIKSELDDFPSEEAISKALSALSALGITDLESPEIYAFSLSSLETMRDGGFAFAFNENYPLTKDNEIYVLRFRQLFNGIELARVGANIKDFDDSGNYNVDAPSVTVGVSQYEIFFLGVSSVYEQEFEIISREPPKYDINYALGEFASYLENAHFTEETQIRELKPVYFPTERSERGYIEYLLAWCFEGTVRYESDGSSMDDFRVIIASDTGLRNNYKG